MGQRENNTKAKTRLLTGDTPTGALHLGHWVGSLENRVNLQEQHESYFILANYHAFCTLNKRSDKVRENTLQIALDYLAAGIDPNKSTIFVQSDVPAIHELTFIFSMLVTPEKLLHNPTLKTELKQKSNNKGYPLGFVLYPLGQAADILAFRPELVPVGEDQLPHLELTNFMARKFNQAYCRGSEPFFKPVKPLLGKEKRLMGITPPDSNGNIPKMSKSLGNAILLSDTRQEVNKKVKRIYTDPNRLSPEIPGKIEGNPLWSFLDAFSTDREWLEQAKSSYKSGGGISDRECKEHLAQSINDLLDPMRERRKELEKNPQRVIDILKAGAERANATANETLQEVKELIHQRYI